MSERNRKIKLYYHVHLLSEIEEDVLSNLAKAIEKFFPGNIQIIHYHNLHTKTTTIETALKHIKDFPGTVMYALADDNLRTKLEKHCDKLNLSAVSIMDPVLTQHGRYLGGAIPPTYSKVDTPKPSNKSLTELKDLIGSLIENLDLVRAHDDNSLEKHNLQEVGIASEDLDFLKHTLRLIQLLLESGIRHSSYLKQQRNELDVVATKISKMKDTYIQQLASRGADATIAGGGAATVYIVHNIDKILKVLPYAGF